MSRPTGQLVDGQSVENSDEDAGASQQEVLSSGTCYVTPSPGVLVPPTQLPINGGGVVTDFQLFHRRLLRILLWLSAGHKLVFEQ